MDIIHEKYLKAKDNSFNETTRKLARDIIAYLEYESEFV